MIRNTLYSLLLSFCFIPVSIASPITGDGPSWVRSHDLVSGRISRTTLTGMKNKAEAVIGLFRDSFFSAGAYTPVWHGEYYADRSLPTFAVQSSFFPRENTGARMAELLVLANDLSPLLRHYTLNGNDHAAIKGNIADRNGCRYVEVRAQDDRTTRFWLITGDSSRQPYLPLTRREYLLETRTALIQDTSRIATGWRNRISIRPAAIQEAEKQKELQRLQAMYSGTDLDVHTRIFLRNFVSDEAYLQENIRSATSLQRRVLHFIDSLLLHGDQLGRPAVIREPAAADPTGNAREALPFEGFADGDPDAITLVRLDTHPSTADQPSFFLVGWRFEPAEALAADLDRQLCSGFDGHKLQELLKN
jgi:hypothetical protein